MPQLDFREALSTPEEKVFSGPASAPSLRVTETQSFLRDVGLSHSTWANIAFVAIATVGALVSAFYFFNGAETLRAAAAWPGEFLYPRPVSTGRIDVAMQPISVDRYDRDSNRSATKSEGAEDSGTPDFRNPQLAQATPFSESQDSTPVVPPSDGTSLPFPPSALPVTPVTPVLPVPPLQPVVPPPTDSIFYELNSLQPATGTFVQSTLQTISETFTDVLPKTAPAVVERAKVSVTRKKIANTRTKSTARNSVSSTVKSSSQTPQKIATQIQEPIIQNQTMFGGGMGATSGLSGIGSAAGGGTGVSASGVGTTGGVSGVGSGGIGGVGGVGGVGGIGGVGGLPGVGGVVGGLPGGLPGHH